MTRLYANIAVILVAVMLGGMALLTYDPSLFGLLKSHDNDQFADCRTSRVAAGKATIGGPFELVRMDGVTVTDKDVFTKPSLLYFGYTYCPDVCPLDNARNAEAIDLLTERGLDVQPVFISIDPERDTPEMVLDFAEALHEKMIGLTGSAEQVKAASRAYKTYYRRASDDEDYVVDHSTFTYLVLPQLGFVEFFKRETTPEEMATTVACFVDKQ